MKIITGTVTSTKMAKTATVTVIRFVAHPLYKKRMKRVKKYQVHDEVGHSVGEIVDFVACAPISKSKKWKIVEKAPKAAKVESKKEVVAPKTAKKSVAKKEVKAKPAKKAAK